MRAFLSDDVFGAKAPPKKADAENSKGRKLYLAEMIDELGFGLYQCQVWILCCGFIFAEGAEVQMASGLVSSMTQEFHIISHVGKAMLMTWTFIGFALGTMVSGPLGDSVGRRNPMLLGYCGVVCTACCTTLVTNRDMLYAARLILGFFAGVGIPTALISISEVTPSRLRGKTTAALGIAYCAGELWAAVGFTMLMPDLINGSWRMLIGWAMVPALCLIMFGLLSPVTRHDTPFFLACHGKTEELREALNLAAEMNGKPELVLSDNDVVVCEMPEKIPVLNVLPTLLKGPNLTKVLVMCYMMFAKDLAFYGTDVFWPQAWAQVPGLESLNPSQELVVTAFFGVPGVFLATILMTILPRKVGVLCCAMVCSACVLFLRGLANGKGTAFAGVLVYKLLFPTWQMTTMLLPSELFGTQIRGWGFSCAAMVGRLATIISPFLVELGTDSFTATLASVTVGAALIVNVLPETKDCDLAEDAISTGSSSRRLAEISGGDGSYGAVESAKV